MNSTDSSAMQAAEGTANLSFAPLTKAKLFAAGYSFSLLVLKSRQKIPPQKTTQTSIFNKNIEKNSEYMKIQVHRDKNKAIDLGR